MAGRHLRTYTELEGRIDAARQLRAETIASGMRTFAPFAKEAIRSPLVRIAARTPDQIAADRAARTLHRETVWN